MAILDFEGFGFSTASADFGTYGVFSNISGLTSITTTSTTFGDPAAVLNGTGQNGIIKTIPNTQSLFFGARMKGVSVSNNVTGFGYFNLVFNDATAGAAQVTIGFDYTGGGAIKAYRGPQSGGTLLGTSAAGLAMVGVWAYVEVGVVIGSGTSGSVVVKVNGTTVLNLTGINTLNTTNAYTNQVQMLTGAGGNSSTWHVQHMYWADNTGSAPGNTFLGDVRVTSQRPTSNGTVQFAPTGLASNYLNAAKNPPLPAADFNSDSTVGDQDLFNIAALPTGLGAIYAVQVRSLALRDSAGSRSIANKIKSGTATGTGAAYALGAAALVYKDVFVNDPNTAAAWTVAGVNAAQVGYAVAA